MDNIVEILRDKNDLPDDIIAEIIESGSYDEQLRAAADEVRRKYYGTDVYIRGLIEFTSFCRNDCLYCGLRCSNRSAARYRLSKEQILSCCRAGYPLGFRTFVLQGGEDPYYTDDIICGIVSAIRREFPDCAITLSIGEKSRESYQAYFDAGADRFLLRHETADGEHYAKLHPARMSSGNRKRCLYDLKDIGYQVGTGFMVGSPYQSTENIIADLRFMQELQPDMIGIGPFISHKDTPFRDMPCGTAELTVRLISVLRLMFPRALIPATTALGTITEGGRERGLKAGANVVMPNLSPADVKGKYDIYDNKLATGAESAEHIKELREKIVPLGYDIKFARGDVSNYQK